MPCRASKYVFATAVNGAVGGVNVAVYWHEPTINLKLEIYPLIYPLAKLLDTPINVLPEIKTHLVIPVELEKTLLYFLIDTGAEISYLDEDIIKKLNLDSISTRKYTNFTGDIRESNTYIIPNLCLKEKLCSQNIELLSNQNMRHFLGQNSVKVSGLFGVNWLKNYYLLIRYPDRKVFLKSKRI